jgi:hypothetical protein
MTRKANSLTITYLTKVTFASLNGGDSDADNINAIKKVTLPDGSQIPYMSSQSIRYGIRKIEGYIDSTLKRKASHSRLTIFLYS